MWILRLERWDEEGKVKLNEVGMLTVQSRGPSTDEVQPFVATILRHRAATPVTVEIKAFPIGELGPWYLVHRALDLLAGFHRPGGA